MRSLIKNTILYCYYVSSLWKKRKSENKNKIAILMYHGVTTKPLPVWTQVQAIEFEQQMRYIAKKYHPVSLSDVVDAIKNKTTLPPYAVVVTFDDGFKNNFSTAYPILKNYSIPATIFLTTSFIEKNNQFEGLIWTDYVMALLLETDKKKIPSPFDNNKSLPIFTIDDKIYAKSYICERLKQEPYEKKNKILSDLKNQLAVGSLSAKSDLFHGLHWDEIVELDRENLITFGSHTINHEILSQIPESQLEKEILTSKKQIEQHLQHDITLFAYPNGQPKDYNQAAITMVKDNYSGAVSTIEGLSHIEDDIFQLKRLSIGNDTSIWQFKLHLAGVYEKLQSYKKGDD